MIVRAKNLVFSLKLLVKLEIELSLDEINFSPEENLFFSLINQ